MYHYNQEERTEWERRLNILRQKLSDGKIHFASHLIEGARDSLSAIRWGDDGKVDLSTVDSRVRCLALAVTAMQDREDLKQSISLQEIQRLYFDWIDRHFGEYYKLMQANEYSPGQVGYIIAQNEEAVNELAKAIPEFVGLLSEFWTAMLEPAYAHLEDSQTLKGIFGGDLFPLGESNIASRCGLYTDTIVLSDPFLKTGPLFERLPKAKSVEFFVKHALNILQYRSLALANVTPAIVVILPEKYTLDANEQDIVNRLAIEDTLIHSTHLFNQSFVSMNALREYLQPFNTPNKLGEAVANPARLLFDADWIGAPAEQIARSLESEHANITGISHAGEMLVARIYGRMAQANDLLLKSFRLRGIPLIEAPTSWEYFNWKLEYDTNRREVNNDVALHVVRGLQQAADNKMTWLGKIPPDALIEIRQQGALDEIREILSRRIEELIVADPNDFTHTGEQLLRNIQDAFDQHESQIKILRGKQWRFAGSDIGAWLVTGTVTVAAAITGKPLLGILGWAIPELVEAPRLRELPGKFRELQEEANKIRRSPIGMLFKCSESA